MGAQLLDLMVYDVINAVVRLQFWDGLGTDRRQAEALGAGLEVSLPGGGWSFL